MQRPPNRFSSPQVYANGIRNIDLQFIIRKLAAPVISVLLLALCVPYVIAAGVVPAVGGFNSEDTSLPASDKRHANDLFLFFSFF